MDKTNEINIFKLRNHIREYAWGSKTFIANLQGKDEASGAGGYSQGGEVRGTGSAVKGLGFKGVF